LTENAGRENDGPSKLHGMKLQDVKLQDMNMTDRQGVKLWQKKYSFNRDNIKMKCANF